MTPSISPANLAAFALQVTVIVAAGGLLARALRIDTPGALLAYWRTLLFACLVLPLCQPWKTAAPPPVIAAVATPADGADSTRSDVSATSQPAATVWRPGELLLPVIAAGIAARLAWLGLGAYGLLRLRRRARLLDQLPEAIARARTRVGADARFYISDQISGPMTYGVIRPVIVLPPGICGMPAHVQEAIACHELLHVRRRDWLCELLEVTVATALWFHPAVWVAIDRIRLAREQVVDEATIRLTDSRERYVESLLAVARARLFPSFSPASPFLRRRLLKQRVARILQESTMTTRRLLASLAVSAAALILTAALAVRSFPLEAQGQPAAASNEPIQVVKGGEHLLHGDRPEYPRRAIEQKIAGDVQVEMTLDDRGEVSDARVLSGPEELRKATLESVLQWHYSPAAVASTTTYATLRFRVPPPLTEQERKEKIEILSEGVSKMELAHHRVEEMEKAIADPAITDERRRELKMRLEKTRAEIGEVFLYETQPGTFTVTRREKPEGFEGPVPLLQVKTERVPEETAREVLRHAGLSIGDPVTAESLKRIAEAARTMDEHFRVDYKKADRGIVLMILAK